MTERVAWLLRVSIKANRDQDFLDLMKEMATATEREAGTIGYQWTLADDDQSVHILEQFADSAGALAHLEGFGAFAARFLDILDVVGLTVYGEPSAAVREGVAGFAPAFYTPIGGFVRTASDTLESAAPSAAAGAAGKGS